MRSHGGTISMSSGSLRKTISRRHEVFGTESSIVLLVCGGVAFNSQPQKYIIIVPFPLVLQQTRPCLIKIIRNQTLDFVVASLLENVRLCMVLHVHVPWHIHSDIVRKSCATHRGPLCRPLCRRAPRTRSLLEHASCSLRLRFRCRIWVAEI